MLMVYVELQLCRTHQCWVDRVGTLATSYLSKGALQVGLRKAEGARVPRMWKPVEKLSSGRDLSDGGSKCEGKWLMGARQVLTDQGLLCYEAGVGSQSQL